MCHVVLFSLFLLVNSSANTNGSKNPNVCKLYSPFSLDVLSLLVISVYDMVSMYRRHYKTCFSSDFRPHTSRLLTGQRVDSYGGGCRSTRKDGALALCCYSQHLAK